MFEFLYKNTCAHDKITPNMKAGYCPDCGEYVENHWYISRCKCCGVKQIALVRNGKIVTNAKYCRNCGGSAFIVEELEQLDIVSVNYAVVKKQVARSKKHSFIETWIENNYTPMKLLPGY